MLNHTRNAGYSGFDGFAGSTAVSYSLATEATKRPLRGQVDIMQVIYGSCAVLLVVVVYLVRRAYLSKQLQRLRTLHQRVAFMLWVMADRMD